MATPVPAQPVRRRSSGIFNPAILILLAAVLLTFILHRYGDFYPASLPPELFGPSVAVPESVDRALDLSERIGDGRLPGPEDLAYDSAGEFLYTGCADGWIRRVKLEGGADGTVGEVEDWAYVGGRPLGIAFAPDGGLVVAESFRGLLKISAKRTIELLTDEADGLKFKLIDGVDVATDGVIYFTDASYKYNLATFMTDFLECRPHGRLMSFDPATNTTAVLVTDLYFANGVSLSPDQNSVIFCETVMRRCKRHHIRGEKKGETENFIEHLPGNPDNIRVDTSKGQYWIALVSGRTPFWDAFYESPLLRKALYVAEKFVKLPLRHENSGMLSVTLDGEPVSLYRDRRLELVTGALEAGKHVYYGSLIKHYISRIDVSQKSSSVADE